MIVHCITSQFPLFLPESKTPRSPGVHMSGIIRCIATETGILKPEWAEEISLTDVRAITDPIAILRINIGLAWEQHYIGTILARYGVADHPDEVKIDGIYGSPDAERVSVIESISVIITAKKTIKHECHEIKATYKSTKTVGDLTSQWMWLTQLKAYCKALRTRFAVLHILFLCGDYTFPIKPVREVYEIEFTQQEIDDCWDLLRDYKESKDVA